MPKALPRTSSLVDDAAQHLKQARHTVDFVQNDQLVALRP